MDKCDIREDIPHESLGQFSEGIFRYRRYLNRRGCLSVRVVVCFTKLFQNRFRDCLTLRYLPQRVVSELLKGDGKG